jgi:lipopolysaccharide export system protein LptA
VVTNIVKESVERFTGGVESYSVAWANNYRTTGADLIDRGKLFSVEDPAAEVTVNLHYHFLVIDAYLNTEVPVTVTDLTLNSDKVIIKDAMRVSELLSVNANSLSIHRNLKLGKETFLGSGVYSKVEGQAVWDNKVAPNLENFTNFAKLQIPGQAKFGNDRNNSYQSWVNKGTTLAQDIFIDSDYVQNNGDLIAEGTVSIDAKQMVLQDGNINTGESLMLNAENLKMRFQTNTIGSRLVLNVSNVLSDGGVGANNIMTLGRGFVLQQKPKAGNLLGTEIIATADDFVSQEMVWNAKDYGVTVKGFENNAALGRLILKNGKLSKFEFLGSEEENNAMYVDYIEFDQLTKDDIKDGRLAVLDIKPGFTLYFAASNLPAEELDGMYNGRLRWVKEYPGHNSSMPVYISGIDKTIRVNRSFRESIAYDTDDDGIANGYDLSPFGNGVPEILSVSLDVDRKIRIKWTGLPSTLYRLEYKETLGDSNWETLTEYYNDQYIVREITHQEILSNKKISKFYRVLYIE